MRIKLILMLQIANAAFIYADEHFVSFSGSDTPPYTNWSMAAHTIQSAVDATTSGDIVWVAPGVYDQGFTTNGFGRNRLAIEKAISVRAVSNKEATIIQGYRGNVSNQVRCVFIDSGALISGFTIINGSAQSDAGWVPRGGGVYMDEGAMLDNCVIRNCIAWNGGGIAGTTFPDPAGDYCVVSNSVVVANQSQNIGGGVIGVRIVDSLVQSNNADHGGGIANSLAERCVIRRNSADSGGGAMGEDELPGIAILVNCAIVENSARIGVGLKGNSGIIAFNCTLYNFENGNHGREALDASLVNCLIRGPGGVEDSGMLSCLHTANPFAFMNPAQGDYRPHPASPAINFGSISNLPAAFPQTTDIRGFARVVGADVDAGAYEFRGDVDGGIPAAWLSDHSLPTNQSVNFLDPDGDKFSTWHEYIAYTDPTNGSSYFRVSEVATGETNPISIKWTGFSNRIYTLEHADETSGLWEIALTTNPNANSNCEYSPTNPIFLQQFRLTVTLNQDQ